MVMVIFKIFNVNFSYTYFRLRLKNVKLKEAKCNLKQLFYYFYHILKFDSFIKYNNIIKK
jgi:hypothetical protein